MLSVRKMAAVLGISKSQVSRAKADGMPMGDEAAARAWRAEHIDIARAAESRPGWKGVQPPSMTTQRAAQPAAELEQVHQLGAAAMHDFSRHSTALRAAMGALPINLRDSVRLEAVLWDQLLRQALGALSSAGTSVEMDRDDMVEATVWSLASGELFFR